MTKDNPLDPTLYGEAAISAETAALNAEIVARLNQAPDQWSMPPPKVRALRKAGGGPFPPAPLSERALTRTIPGPAGDIEIRVIAPERGETRGVYLYIHGGGWVLGGAEEHDPRLLRIADDCGLTAVSVEYRLAPEHPYPAGAEDCEAAALWLAKNAYAEFGSSDLYIGGESAGAHLAVLALLRLRDTHRMTPFKAANLVCGCFDLSLTPSARNWGGEKLILNSRDIANFVGCFVPDGDDLRDPAISPLYADLSGLPPALFTVGTRDALLDDSLFMASRWAAAGNRSELAVYPGGAHFFLPFPGALAEQALQRCERFLCET